MEREHSGIELPMDLIFCWQEHEMDVAAASSERTRRVLKPGLTSNAMKNAAAPKSVRNTTAKAAGLPKPSVPVPKVPNPERMMVALWDLHCGHRFYRVSSMFSLLQQLVGFCCSRGPL